MNLRILKKLSKRAAPLLAQLQDHREQFLAVRGENYTGSYINDRKHWERNRTAWNDAPEPSRGRLYYRSRKGHVISMSNHYVHPLPGTVMIGAVSGYYEPEWDEETAFDALRDWVVSSFMSYDLDTGNVTRQRRLKTPTEIFRAAAELIEQTNHRDPIPRESNTVKPEAGARNVIYVGYDNCDGRALAQGTAIVSALKSIGIDCSREEYAD